MDTTLPQPRRPALLPGNAAGALVVGTFAGSSLLAMVVGVGTLVGGLTQGGLDAALGGGVLLALLFFLFSLPVWAVGLVVVGIPGWIGLHRLGWRSRWAGAAFGGAATFIAAWVLSLRLDPQNPSAPWEIATMAGVLALIGAAVGWVVMATAYAETEAPR